MLNRFSSIQQVDAEPKKSVPMHIAVIALLLRLKRYQAKNAFAL